MKGYPPSRGGCEGCRRHRSLHAYEPEPGGLGRRPPGRCGGKDCSCPGFQSPEVCMQRLLSIETPEDARKISDALESGWRYDYVRAFMRAANVVFGAVEV